MLIDQTKFYAKNYENIELLSTYHNKICIVGEESLSMVALLRKIDIQGKQLSTIQHHEGFRKFVSKILKQKQIISCSTNICQKMKPVQQNTI